MRRKRRAAGLYELPETPERGTRPLPPAFVLSKTRPTWRGVALALEHGWLAPSAAKELADRRRLEEESVRSVLWTLADAPADAPVQEFVYRLAAREPARQPSELRSRLPQVMSYVVPGANSSTLPSAFPRIRPRGRPRGRWPAFSSRGLVPEGSVTILQGEDMGRPSRLEIVVRGEEVRLLGAAITVAEGTLRLA